MPSAENASERSLKDVHIFSQIAADDRQIIENKFCAFTHYEPGAMIVDVLDSTDDVFFVISAVVSVTLYSSEGRVISFREMGAGETFGEVAALDGGPRSARVEVLGEGLIASMTAEEFRTILQRYPSVALALLQDLVRTIRDLTTRVYEFSALPVAARLQAELLRLAKLTGQEGQGPDGIAMPTHEKLASRISTHREAVTRELKRLEELGIIERHGRRLVIKDLSQLNAMVDGSAFVDKNKKK
jgi:CRP-like cAMP-binding protein